MLKGIRVLQLYKNFHVQLYFPRTQIVSKSQQKSLVDLQAYLTIVMRTAFDVLKPGGLFVFHERDQSGQACAVYHPIRLTKGFSSYTIDKGILERYL